MRSAFLLLLRVGLLAGPTVVALASGGYFERATAWAGIFACALVVLAALAVRPVLPRGGAGRAALAGMALLTGWIFLSRTWAPLDGPALQDSHRALLYLAALVAGCAAWRGARAARVVEPALALGALVVVAYGLSGRLLPGVVHLHHSASAGGRLEQPLTYWNAMGLLGAIGMLLCVRMAGDEARGVSLRAVATGAAPVLATGIYLTFSRGALAALGLGLVALCVLAPSWPQLRAGVIALEAGVLAAALSSLFGGVESLHGSLGQRESQGAAMLAILLVVCGGAAAVQAWACREESNRRVRSGALALPRRASWVAALLVVGALAFPVVAGAVESTPHTPAFGATAQRFGSAGSNRYAYWRAALETFGDHPVRGTGAAGFRVAWLRRRHIADTVRDAHSLEIETAAELGLVGLAALALLFGGVGVAGRRLYRRAPGLAAGPIAALVVWLVHSALDWDWEMPAVTLVAAVLAGVVVAAGEEGSAAGAEGSERLAG